jgi:uncharacterized protein with PQ loop repeat
MKNKYFIFAAILWFVVYALLIMNFFLSMKYQIELDVDVQLANELYQLATQLIILNFIWFVFSIVLIISFYRRGKNKFR